MTIKFYQATGLAAAVLLGASLAAGGQQTGTSLADAARRARAEKKPPTKPVRVFTNDDVPKVPHAATPAGETAPASPATEAAPSEAPPATGAAPPAASTETPAGESEKQNAAKRSAAQASIDQAKQELESAQKDLDLLRREFDLARKQFYSNPNYTLDSSGKAHLDDLASQIQDKQAEVEQLQQRLSDLQDALRELEQRTAAPPAAPPGQ